MPKTMYLSLQFVSSLLLFGCVDQSVDPKHYLNDQLFSAVSARDVTTAARLIKSGADVNCEWETMDTPLMNASQNNDVEMVKLFLANGAMVNKQNYVGDTALDITSSNEIRRILKAKGGKRGDKSKVAPH